jgi:hypothetical protein
MVPMATNWPQNLKYLRLKKNTKECKWNLAADNLGVFFLKKKYNNLKNEIYYTFMSYR